MLDARLEERFTLATADVSKPDALLTSLGESGVEREQIDVAIINAGVKEESALPDMMKVLRRVFDVNVFGAMETASALLPAFQRRGQGHLIFISSQGRWHGMPASGSYNASKVDSQPAGGVVGHGPGRVRTQVGAHHRR